MNHEVCGFGHLHTHSHYSLLDGYATVPELAARAVKNGQKHLCISDHGMMGAVPNQIAACAKNKLEPIFAVELFVNPYQIPMDNDEERKKYVADLSEENKVLYRKNNHLLAIAYSEEGYRNIVRLTSWGYLYGWGGKPSRPRVNLELLMQHKEGVIFTSCCYASQIGFAFETQGWDAAEDMVCRYMAMFGENFRLEIMMLDFHKQKPYDKFIIAMHMKYHIPMILTQDVHYAEPEDSKMQQKMLMMQTGRTIQELEKVVAEGGDAFELQDSQLWLKSEDELNKFWESSYSDVIDYEVFKQAKRESVRLCEKASGVKLNRDLKLPQFPNADDRLLEEIKKGVRLRGLKTTPLYMDRIKEEYELITRKGFSTYFLIEKMFTDIARSKGPEILGYGDPEDMVGPGRGSAVGAITSYLLGVTDVDPIEHDLLFSRFISEDRGRKLKYKMDGVEPLAV